MAQNLLKMNLKSLLNIKGQTEREKVCVEELTNVLWVLVDIKINKDNVCKKYLFVIISLQSY